MGVGTDVASLRVGVERLPHAEGLPLPRYETEHSAGLDLLAAIGENEKITLESGKWVLVPTGLKLHLPEGHEGQVRPRSGLALKHGVTVLNAPGTIDADYRGEVGVILVNHGPAPFVINRGMRVAQLVVAAVTRVRLAEEGALEKTGRGQGGFGSTGV
ncbi:dUTP diphosphatase [Alsobacter sp. KACC 23698]|uniref:Deoxyuridine 5'-triphosphate nucleotidohydrolase n=1 Tax=Alsobacter sp. KACC 23698 TaxID=3149229 RepID=A0AAU7JFB5_9HYPH